jgi:hypothetical protein
MVDQTKGLVLQLNDGYRSASRTNSVLCALAIAWSAAQFELKTLNLGFANNIDMANASIPLILFCAIVYTAIRHSTEFAMQSVETRRWGYAQFDYKLSVYLVRFALLMLAASGLSRSTTTLVSVIINSLGVIFVSYIAFVVLGIAMSPFMLRAFHLAKAIVFGVLILLIVFIGKNAMENESWRSSWQVPPDPQVIATLMVASILVVLSFYFESRLYHRLFASQVINTTYAERDGSRHTYYETPKPDFWNWSCQDVSQEEEDPKDEDPDED